MCLCSAHAGGFTSSSTCFFNKGLLLKYTGHVPMSFLNCTLTLYVCASVLKRKQWHWKGAVIFGHRSKCSFPVSVTRSVLPCNTPCAGFKLITAKSVVLGYEKWVKVTVLWWIKKRCVCVCWRVWADTWVHRTFCLCLVVKLSLLSVAFCLFFQSVQPPSLFVSLLLWQLQVALTKVKAKVICKVI